MNDFHDYLLVFDMDGSLLNSKHEITKKNIDALDEWRSMGGRLCLASGRSADSLRPYHRLLGCQLPVICGNGSGIYDYEKESFLYNITLPDGGRELAAAADKLLPESGITIYKDGKVYFCKENEATRRNMENEGLPHLSADYNTFPYPWEKILLSQDEQYTDKVHSLMSEIVDQSVFRLLRSAPVYYEILSPAANKGLALKELCNIFGFELSRTVAVGDNENDVSMLKEAGYSFTPSNCTPAAREAAQRVICSCEEGCARDVVDIMKSL